MRVAVLNVKTSNRRFDAAAAWLDACDPDVAVIEEVDADWIEALEKGLEGHRRLPTDTARNDNFGIAVFVRSGLTTGSSRSTTPPRVCRGSRRSSKGRAAHSASSRSTRSHPWAAAPTARGTGRSRRCSRGPHGPRSRRSRWATSTPRSGPTRSGARWQGAAAPRLPRRRAARELARGPALHRRDPHRSRPGGRPAHRPRPPRRTAGGLGSPRRRRRGRALIRAPRLRRAPSGAGDGKPRPPPPPECHPRRGARRDDRAPRRARRIGAAACDPGPRATRCPPGPGARRRGRGAGRGSLPRRARRSPGSRRRALRCTPEVVPVEVRRAHAGDAAGRSLGPGSLHGEGIVVGEHHLGAMGRGDGDPHQPEPRAEFEDPGGTWPLLGREQPRHRRSGVPDPGPVGHGVVEVVALLDGIVVQESVRIARGAQLDARASGQVEGPQLPAARERREDGVGLPGQGLSLRGPALAPRRSRRGSTPPRWRRAASPRERVVEVHGHDLALDRGDRAHEGLPVGAGGLELKTRLELRLGRERITRHVLDSLVVTLAVAVGRRDLDVEGSSSDLPARAASRPATMFPPPWR